MIDNQSKMDRLVARLVRKGAREMKREGFTDVLPLAVAMVMAAGKIAQEGDRFPELNETLRAMTRRPE